jgi:hypothetical protein
MPRNPHVARDFHSETVADFLHGADRGLVPQVQRRPQCAPGALLRLWIAGAEARYMPRRYRPLAQ